MTLKRLIIILSGLLLIGAITPVGVEPVTGNLVATTEIPASQLVGPIPFASFPSLAISSISGSTSAPTYATATFAVIPELSTTITLQSTNLLISWSGSFDLQSNDQWSYSIFLDGVEIANTRRLVQFFGGSLLGLTPARINGLPISQTISITTTTGLHTISIRWSVAAGSARAVLTQRRLDLKELL